MEVVPGHLSVTSRHQPSPIKPLSLSNTIRLNPKPLTGYLPPNFNFFHVPHIPRDLPECRLVHSAYAYCWAPKYFEHSTGKMCAEGLSVRSYSGTHASPELGRIEGYSTACAHLLPTLSKKPRSLQCPDSKLRAQYEKHAAKGDMIVDIPTCTAGSQNLLKPCAAPASRASS